MAKSGDGKKPDTKTENVKPEKPEPKKTDLHPKADDLNQVYKKSNGAYCLICGVTRRDKVCKAYAGRGTDHLGYGRCKNHGGSCTGPVTPEGKAIAAQNSRIHGLYAKVLLPHEQKIFEQLHQAKDLGLENEIRILKTKILSYLEKWRFEYVNNYQDVKKLGGTEETALEFANKKTTVWASFVSEAGNTTGRTCYQAATIEDRALDRALRTLANMVEKHARLEGINGEDLLSQLNQELRAASLGKVGLSWGGQPKGGGQVADGS